MEEISATLVFYGTALLYPIVTGPIAAALLILVVIRGDNRLMLIYWPTLILLHVAGYSLMMHTLGDSGIGPGFISCLAVPVVAASTALGLRLASRRMSISEIEDPSRQRWLLAGIILIPLLQVSTAFLFVLLAPGR